jgi:hypothetical protein
LFCFRIFNIKTSAKASPSTSCILGLRISTGRSGSRSSEKLYDIHHMVHRSSITTWRPGQLPDNGDRVIGTRRVPMSNKLRNALRTARQFRRVRSVIGSRWLHMQIPAKSKLTSNICYWL